MSKMIIICLGVLFVQSGFAQTIEQDEGRLDLLKRTNVQVGSELLAANRAMNAAKNAADAAQKAYDQASREKDAAQNAYYESTNNNGDQASLRKSANAAVAFANAQDKLKIAQANLDTANASLVAPQKSLDAATKAANSYLTQIAQVTADRDQKVHAAAVDATQKAQVAAVKQKGQELYSQLQQKLQEQVAYNNKQTAMLAEIIKSQGLQMQFSQLQQKAGSVQAALNSLSANLNNTILGAYMKDRMGAMLNSNLMCEAQKSCNMGKTPSIPASEIQNKLFPVSATSASGSAATAKSATGAK